ncbi:Malignant T-cell-amplified sequence 1-like [Vitis vinifera]|uniref:Malignant T-cell-amplified sequence 1-like n=1 Tax=Vitis vinifera TaxID=29760 RepID=A0A438FK30_VITVI|nr:Malignant T-cell-amplified sequence 1-like [Vitis vinifera]
MYCKGLEDKMSLVSCEFLWKVYEVAILVFSAVHHLELPHLIQGSHLKMYPHKIKLRHQCNAKFGKALQMSTQDSNQFWMICFRRSPLSLLLNGSHCLIGFVVSFDVLSKPSESGVGQQCATVFQYPNIMKKLQVDRGAIKFVLAGANIMCPGLTSPGGVLDDDVAEESPVAIMAEGKQHALAIGFTKMSAKDIWSAWIEAAVAGGTALIDDLQFSPYL